jgi:biotin operon repressor
MGDGVCWASQQSIADRLGFQRETVNRHIKILKDRGFLEEKMDQSHTTKVYKVPEIDFTLTAGDLNSQGELLKLTPNSEPESHKDSIKIHIKTDEPAPEPTYVDLEPGDEVPKDKLQIIMEKGTTNIYKIGVALAEVWGESFDLNRKRVMKVAKTLSKDRRISPELIRLLYGENGLWYKHDWRGLRGQKPIPENVGSTFMGLMAISKTKTTGKIITGQRSKNG